MFGWGDGKWGEKRGDLCVWLGRGVGLLVGPGCFLLRPTIWGDFGVSMNWGENGKGEGLRWEFTHLPLSFPIRCWFLFFFFKVTFIFICLQTIIYLCNRGMRVNLYKLHFLSSYFSSQPNKNSFSSLHFYILPNTRGKTKPFLSPLFPLPHHFLSP